MTRADLSDIEALAAGRHTDPCSWLGCHHLDTGWVYRTILPGAETATLVSGQPPRALAPATRLHDNGVFEASLPSAVPGVHYAWEVVWPGNAPQQVTDPWQFGPGLGELDLHLIAEGNHGQLARVLGAHATRSDGVPGVRFAVWAPNAQTASVIGDFNGWNPIAHPMRHRGASGVWELFVPTATVGARYKFHFSDRNGNTLPAKADPCAWQAEFRPATASIVAEATPYHWRDADWLALRGARQATSAPISIYEIHPGSWRRVPEDGNRSLNFRELADQLVPYVKSMGFTHIQLMPVSEYPFDGSWGYQPTGLFAVSSRFGSPEDFCFFVEQCHAADIGVLLDWVPGHFPTDPHGLGQFDGTALYEHADPQRGFHPDWNTLIYNYGRNEVANFLCANADHWLEHYHLDGLRVDAVASMLYLDYSREAGQWQPNAHGGRENLEAVAFLQRVNREVYAKHDGVMTVAEESTSWPGVTRAVHDGGLGFGYKWNMGWMNDTLRYMARDPIHRSHHHNELTFGLMYAYSENFILPLSHDEVVHGKGSLLGKMPGDRWQQFANLRAYFGFMWTQPGKKLLFMGGEFAQPGEWNHDASLDWHLLGDRDHAGVHALIKDLNKLYTTVPALHRDDRGHDGFRWLDADDHAHSTLSYLRTDGERSWALVVCNFTPTPRTDYRIGVPFGGHWREQLNTDATCYGGSDLGNLGGCDAEAVGCHGQAYSLQLTLPPLATLVLTAEST
ncbi:MAG: 1,4-alpha-glucan branching protein GlgB, partial [Pseudomonadota bacterium]